MPTRPTFTYFSQDALEPLIISTDAECECCGETPGELYRGPFYTVEEVEYLCLKCISNGDAANKFNGSFNDIVIEWEGTIVDPEGAKAPKAVIEELMRRTPGYDTWQGNRWIFHCGDGGVYQGNATTEAVANASPEARRHFEVSNGNWDRMMAGWTPQSPLCLYHFKCRQCAMDLFLHDCD